MTRIALSLLAGCLAIPALACEPYPQPGLTVTQLIERNVAARGGLEAWRAIQTMVWVGHIERGNAPGTALPFVLEMMRPNKTRFEIHVQNQKFVRMFDGTHGWSLRPTGNGSPDIQPYSAEELRFVQESHGIDGPLMDYLAKGVSVTLEGLDEVEGDKAYRLSVRLPSGASHHVWIDAKSYLDIKSDREVRNALGMSGTVLVYYRNYRTIEGLKIPFLIDIGGAASKSTDKLIINNILLNPPLADWMFAKPKGPEAHHVNWTGGSTSQVERSAWPSTPRDPEAPWMRPGILTGFQ